MRTLLLPLLLVVACAQLSPADDNDSQVSGDWKTLYLASNCMDKISENGLFRVFLQSIEHYSADDSIIFSFFIKIGEECREMSVQAKKVEENLYVVEYKGENYFQIIYWSANSLIIYNVNENGNGDVTKFAALFGKGNNVSEEALERFKQLVKEKNIPEENVEDLTTTDDCL